VTGEATVRDGDAGLVPVTELSVTEPFDTDFAGRSCICRPPPQAAKVNTEATINPCGTIRMRLFYHSETFGEQGASRFVIVLCQTRPITSVGSVARANVT
jgi:hypothetical protein